MKRILVFSISCISAILIGTCSHAALIPPAGVVVNGYGSYTHSAGIISDSVIPPEGVDWRDARCTYWNGTATYFVLNLGNAYNLDHITASVDNNDDYAIYYSMDSIAWAHLYSIPRGAGNISWGMDTFANIPVSASAGYLKIYATGGDNMYSIGELNAYGTSSAVPEPASCLLLGIGGAVLTAFRKRNGVLK